MLKTGVSAASLATATSKGGRRGDSIIVLSPEQSMADQAVERNGPPIERVEARAFRVPTDEPESDGTLAWQGTTLVVVHVHAGGQRGFGYTYADAAAAGIIRSLLAKRLEGCRAFDLPHCWQTMYEAIRNNGRSGLMAMALAGVDNALWDVKARLLEAPVVELIGSARRGIAAYGSGGFTSYSTDRLREQLSGWAQQGMRFVKMKIGRDAQADPHRVRMAREAIGPGVQLFVDANGGYSRKQALEIAGLLKDLRVTWFEEPVDHEDLAGLRLLRDRGPGGMDIAAGEYGFEVEHFRRLLEAGAVDVLQADATRCGTTGFLQAAALCEAFRLPLSAHCAPSLHAHLCCATPPARHVEYFHDHVRIEQMLFDGAPRAVRGELVPDRTRLGWGLELKEEDARRYEL